MKKNVLIACLLGNFLEFYDLALYGALAPIIIPLFFPTNDIVSSTVLSMGVFASGFLARPLGGIIFGYIGDSLGRKKALVINTSLMAVASLGIGCLPTQLEVGLFAPIGLTLLRILQGVCVGGEYNGAAIFLLENTPGKERYKLGSFVSAAGILGFLITSLVANFFVNLNDALFFWRIPFWLGALICVLSFYMRYNLFESSEFIQAAHRPEEKISLIRILTTHKSAIFSTIGIGWFAGVFVLFLTSYMPSYLIEVVKFSKNQAFIFNNIGVTFCLVSTLISGVISGWLQKDILMRCAPFLAILYAAFFFIFEPINLWIVFAEQLGLSVIAGLFIGPMHYFLLQTFPVRSRYKSISLCFSLGVGLFGSTTPLISTWLMHMTGISTSPAIYLALTAIVGIFSLQKFQWTNSVKNLIKFIYIKEINQKILAALYR